MAIADYANVAAVLPTGRLRSGEPRDIPPNGPGVAGRSVHLALLPFLDHQLLFDSANFQVPLIGMTANWTTEMRRLSTFACPSDGLPPTLPGYPLAHWPDPDPPGFWPFRVTNYALAFGDVPVTRLQWESANLVVTRNETGSFNDLNLRWNDIQDGLSNTMFATERALSHVYDRIAQSEGGIGRWLFGDLHGFTLILAAFPPNSGRGFDPSGPWGPVQAASSFHGTGVHVLMGDGSVRFVSETVDSWPTDPVNGAHPCLSAIAPCTADRGLWQKLATRSGNDF